MPASDESINPRSEETATIPPVLMRACRQQSMTGRLSYNELAREKKQRKQRKHDKKGIVI